MPYALLTDHQPSRPSWRCQVDGDHWPCLQGMTDLAEEFAARTTMLLNYMTAQMIEFERDVLKDGDFPARYVSQRFVACIWPAQTGGRAAA